jgi:hypothetical protein
MAGHLPSAGERSEHDFELVGERGRLPGAPCLVRSYLINFHAVSVSTMAWRFCLYWVQMIVSSAISQRSKR